LVLLFIILIVHYFPFIIWLSINYLKLNRNEKGDSKRGFILKIFMFTILFISLVSNIFPIDETYTISIVIPLAILFNIYMLVTVIKDKRAMFPTEEH
jgi:hypothetical protein